jgi:hypothetical protein
VTLRPLALLLLWILAGCAARESSAPDAQSTVAPTTTRVAQDGSSEEIPAASKPSAREPEQAATRPEIQIERVEGKNPVLVQGDARTFENTVSLRLRDATGALLQETFTTSVGEMGQHNPYEASLWVTRDPGPQITVEVFEHSANDGSIRSLARRTLPYDVERVPIQLFFPVGDCTKIQPFRRTVPKSVAMARLLLEALLAGPTAEETKRGASGVFPRGAAIRSVVLRGDELQVDFNERLTNVGGSCTAQAIRDTVTRTLLQLPSIKRVRISARGNVEQALQP